MTDLNSLKVDELGLAFMDVSVAEEVLKKGGDEETNFSAALSFGPSKQAIASFDNWTGCDGNMYFPYNPIDKIGKISDFVTAAAQAAREKEKELERQEAKKKKEAASTSNKVTKKSAKVSKVREEEKEEAEVVDDDMGFITVEDNRSKQITGKRQQNQ